MQQLLGLTWAEPKLVYYYVRLLEAFGRFVGRVQRNAGPQLLLRLFSLLETMPVCHEAEGGPSEQWKDNYTARQKV